MNLGVVWELVRSDVRRYASSRVAAFWTFVFPLLLFVLLSRLYGNGPALLGDAVLQVADLDGTEQSATLVSSLRRAFEVLGGGPQSIQMTQSCPPESVCLRIPRGYGESVRGAQSVTVQLTTPQSASVAADVMISLIDSTIDKQVLSASSALRPTLQVEGRRARRANEGYSVYLATGLLVMSMLTTALMGFALPLVQMRENGLFKIYQLLPLSRGSYIGAFVTGRLVIMVGFCAVFIGLVAALFGVNFHLNGSNVLAATAVALIASACFVSMGLAVASRISSVPTASVACNALYFIQTFLGNLFIPLGGLPHWLQKGLQFFPASQACAAFRAVFLEYPQFARAAGNLAVLAVWTLAFLVITRYTFLWQKVAIASREPPAVAARTAVQRAAHND
jgi:ABC-2 type transport system permease protein